MSGFQQDPGELTPDELAGRDVDDDGATERYARLRLAVKVVKQERRIATLERQVANLYERLGWRPAK